MPGAFYFPLDRRLLGICVGVQAITRIREIGQSRSWRDCNMETTNPPKSFVFQKRTAAGGMDVDSEQSREHQDKT